MPSIAIRADGSHTVGLGHIVRTLTLSEACRSRGVCDILFLSAADAVANRMVAEKKFTLKTLRSEGSKFPETAATLSEFSPDILINDVLDTSTEYMAGIRPLAKLVVNLDDNGPGAKLADVVINSLPCKSENEGDDRYLRGVQYLILAPDFGRIQGQERRISTNCTSILVTLGGSDTYGNTAKVAEVLKGISELELIEIVVGPSFQHRRELEQVVKGDGRFKVEFAIPNLADAMARHELAVTGGGLTLFEAAALGLPTLSTASETFEEVNAKWCHERGFSHYLGMVHDRQCARIEGEVRSLLGDHERRLAMSARGPETVDGEGSRRVVDVLLAMGS